MDATPTDAAMTDALGAWLLPRLADARSVAVTGLAAPRSGFSAETVVVDAEVDRGGGPAPERFVLRRETPDEPVYPVQVPGWQVEIELQYRAMAALASATDEVPLASLVGYEPDPEVLGAPFFVMGHVAGEVPIESPIYTAEGFFTEASAPQRRRLVDAGLAVVAAVHRAPVDGFAWLHPEGETAGAARQLRLWEEYATRELDGRSHPVLERGFAWLRDHLPAGGEVRVSWGDARPGNIIWQDFRPACATDFEAASLAPRELDLGWWLMFDRWSHEAFGVGRLEGEPTREEQRDLYMAHAGVDVGDPLPWEVFAAARYAAIVVRVMNRMVARGHLPAEQTIWLENQAVDCLAALLPD
jgi:aminoglycoside phosphotransferase (APT) family kinase protein